MRTGERHLMSKSAAENDSAPPMHADPKLWAWHPASHRCVAGWSQFTGG